MGAAVIPCGQTHAQELTLEGVLRRYPGGRAGAWRAQDMTRLRLIVFAKR
jgi:hypothetical protein